MLTIPSLLLPFFGRRFCHIRGSILNDDQGSILFYNLHQVMKNLKGKSSQYLRREFPELSKRYWGMHIWARGYFVSTVGIDREVIRKYVKEQQDNQIREDQVRLWRDSSE
jgi:putative transposase